MSRFGLLWFEHQDIGRRILVLAAVFLVVLLFITWLGWLALLTGSRDLPAGFPRIDFVAYWSSSSLAIHGHASSAYDVAKLHAEQMKLPGDKSVVEVWHNPPFFFFLILPLSLLPIAASLGVWVVGTVGLLEAAVWRITRNWKFCLLVLAFPATLWNALVGQTGFLLSALLAWAIILLPRKPAIAGLFFALIAIKPQFFPVVMIALFAGREKRALAATMMWLAILMLLSVAAFGLNSWLDFITSVRRSAEGIYTGGHELSKMQSFMAEARLFGLNQYFAQAIQLVVSAGSACMLYWLWQRPSASEYKAAGLAITMLMAAPYSYHYDLQFLALATVWLGQRAQEEGWLPLDLEVMALAWLALYALILVGPLANVSLGPVVLLVFLAILLICKL